MELWNDYEGKTVDGLFPLERLLSPEGRSAFFATKDAGGSPAVIRLIEGHFDEAEILERWQKVAELGQEHLVGIERAGRAEIDGTSLVYAVMESTDADLAAILRERPLSAEETKQVGTSVVGALEALHGAGLVHEHVEPANVLAKGEVVKLRSDCVREAPEGREGDEARARDVEGLATLLLQALTQRRQPGAVGGSPLPWPFEEVVRNGMSGAWGLGEISRALTPPAPAAPGTKPNGAGRRTAGSGVSGSAMPVVAPKAAVAAGGGSGAAQGAPVKGTAPAAPGSRGAAGGGVAAGSVTAGGVGPGGSASVGSGSVGPGSVGSAGVASGISAAAVAAGLPGESPVSAYARTERAHAPEAPGRIVMEPTDERRKRLPMVAGGTVAALLLAGVGWHFAHRPAAPAGPAVTTTRTAATASGAGTSAETASSGAATGAATVPLTPRAEKPSAVVDGGNGGRTAAGASGKTNWRVVAFTYNREDQAQHKVAEIAARHAGLRPGVFTPTGRAPYLVTLGGDMTRQEAVSLRKRARSEGLPRDTFARNYRSR